MTEGAEESDFNTSQHQAPNSMAISPHDPTSLGLTFPEAP